MLAVTCSRPLRIADVVWEYTRMSARSVCLTTALAVGSFALTSIGLSVLFSQGAQAQLFGGPSTIPGAWCCYTCNGHVAENIHPGAEVTESATDGCSYINQNPCELDENFVPCP